MAPEEQINFNRLVQIYQQEKKGGPPIHLEADFHDKVRDFLAMIKESYDQERTKDPSSMKALQLADQLQKVRGLQVDVLNLRLRKFLLLAHQTLTSGRIETKNFTPEERELFEAMVAELCKGRNRIIDGGSGTKGQQGPHAAAPVPHSQAQSPQPVPPGPLPTPQTRAVCELPLIAAPEEKGAASRPAGKKHSAVEDGDMAAPTGANKAAAAPPAKPGALVVVRILEDLPDFAFGDKGGYSLKKKDVVALPGDIAAVLQAHGKAKPVQ